MESKLYIFIKEELLFKLSCEMDVLKNRYNNKLKKYLRKERKVDRQYLTDYANYVLTELFKRYNLINSITKSVSITKNDLVDVDKTINAVIDEIFAKWKIDFPIIKEK